jgi:hypothetical protein
MPFQPTNQGYDTFALKQPSPPGVNGYLVGLDNQREVSLWVTEVSTAFAMSGSTGQSYRTRSFFPHNMEQTKFTITSQFPNQETYANAIEFIRKYQVKFTSSMRLQVISRGIDHNGNLKGSHNDLDVEGYVGSVKRIHERFVYAPTLQFEFISERILLPKAWADGKIKIKLLKTWKEIIEDKKPGFINQSTLPTSGDAPSIFAGQEANSDASGDL